MEIDFAGVRKEWRTRARDWGGLSPDFRHKEESNKKPVKSEPYKSLIVFIFSRTIDISCQ